MKKHRLLSGESIDLKDLGRDELAFLGRIRAMAKSGVSFFDIERAAIGLGSPALLGWTRVTPEIVASPLYQVASDLAMRAGIAEGLILAREHEHLRSTIPSDRSQMSVTQASMVLGISRAAVHKAIKQGRLLANRYGNVILVNRAAVFRFKEERKAGGKKSESRRRGTSATEDRTPMVAKAR